MNFSISEIILILLIALIVVKPEQLPDVAFSLGRFAKNMRDMFSKVKDEVSGIVESIEKPAKKEPNRPTLESPAIEPTEKVNEQQQ